jgi:transposase
MCSRYVDLAVAQADLSRMVAVAIDETSCRRGHDYLTIAADAAERKVVFVTTGRDATTIVGFAEHLAAHKARPEQITAVSIDMSPAFIRGVTDHPPKARITFDKFPVVAHASAALNHSEAQKSVEGAGCEIPRNTGQQRGGRQTGAGAEIFDHLRGRASRRVRNQGH